MNKQFYEYYVFLDQINNLVEKNLLKFSNINIIIDIDHLVRKSLQDEYSIIKFAKKNKIPFILKNNFTKCIKYKADGIYIESQNTKIIRPFLIKKKFKIIGVAHNQLEYFKKKYQNCNLLMLSPLFCNNKYSPNKILNVFKFNNKANVWTTQVCALGGINYENVKKIKLLNVKAIAFKKFIFDPKIKKPAYNLM
jgi:thiamine monophosphate synthase